MAESIEDKEHMARLGAQLRRKPGPLIPLPEEDEDEDNPFSYRRGSSGYPRSHSQGSSSSSENVQLDTTSGMDEAVRRADALSEAVAQRDAAMYGGPGGLDMAAALSATDRIRSLRDYLRAVSDEVTDSNPYPFAVPLLRLGGVSRGSNANTGTTHVG